MENESTSNNFDITPIVEELQILNKGVLSNGEKLDSITEYLIAKEKQDKAKEEEQLKKEEEQLKKDQEEKDLKEEEAAKQTEQSDAKAAAQEETYTELLSDGIAEMQLTNQLLSVQTIYFGIVIGLLFIKIFFDNLTKR